MSVLEKLKKQIDSHEVISFDIFDTLLLRPYVKPTDLFMHMEKIYNASGFAENRIKSEQEARKKHSDKEDITLDEIYDEVLVKYKDFKQKEMDFEAQVLQPNPQMKEVFDYAKKQNKKIIIISDMYLPQDFLEKVLKEKGFAGFEKLYVSSTYGKLKYSGNLFKEALKDLNIVPRNVFHIGDSERNDFLVPKKIGLSSFLYPNNMQQFLNKNFYLKKVLQEQTDSLGISIIIGIFSIYSINNEKGNYWATFGYRMAGPICLSFMNWVYTDLKVKNIDNVIFIARDGHILEKIFNLIDDKKIPTHYIYAPRSLNLICRLNYEKEGDFVYEHTQTILNFYKQKDENLALLPKATSAKEGVKQLEDNISKIRLLAENEKDAYRSYIQKKHIKGKIATIDSVSMFFSAQRFFEELFPENEFLGYYYQIQTGAILTNNVTSYKKIAPYSQDLKLIEFIMTSPEPPINYIEKGVPIYKEISSEEQKRINACLKFSEMAVKFVQDVKRIFNDFNLYLTETEISSYINCFIQFPENEDKKAFSDVLFAYDPEHKKYIHLFDFWKSSSNERGRDVVIMLGNLPIFTLKKRNSCKDFFLFNIPILTISKREEW